MEESSCCWGIQRWGCRTKGVRKSTCHSRHLVLGLVERAGDVALLKVVNDLDILRGEFEVKRLEVGLDAVGGQRLGEDDVALGGVPVEEDLRGGLAVLLSKLANDGVLELVATCERRVGLDGDAVLAADVDEVLALEEGVDLNLVDSGDNRGLGHELLEVVDTEVGDTNGADLAEALGSLKSSPGGNALLLVVRGGVDEVEVEVVELELLKGVAEGVEGSFVAVVSIPELGGDEDLATGSASLLEPLLQGAAASLLVGVSGCRVDVAVSGIEGGDDSLLSLLAVGGLVDTEGNLGNLVAVVKLDGEAGRVAGRGVSRVLAARVDNLLHTKLRLAGSELNGGHFECGGGGGINRKCRSCC